MGRMDKYWEKAVECRLKDDLSDIEAMQAVWNMMMPPATVTQLATIIGAVYADNYWVKVQMKPDILSASLQQAEGWDKSTCDNAAKTAFSQWYGLMVRNDFADVGMIPKAGCLTNSPDTLCNEGGALDRSTMLQKWNSYFYNQAVVGKNYCYSRAQCINIPIELEAQSVTAKMFFAEPALNPPPQSWQAMKAIDDQGYQSLMYGLEKTQPIREGDRIASGSFMFEPPAKKHYCMVSVAQSKLFKNDPLHQGGNFNSSTWRVYNGAGGWHNINPQAGADTCLKYYNQDARDEVFSIEAHCVNLPQNTKLSLESQESNFGGVKQEIRNNIQMMSTGRFAMPPNHVGNLVVRIETPNNKPMPPNASCELTLKWHLQPSHMYYGQVIEQMGFAAYPQQEIERPLGNYIIIGEYQE